MDMVENSTAESNPAPYPCIFNIPGTLPEITELIQPLNLNYAKPNWLESKWFSMGHWGGVTELFVQGVLAAVFLISIWIIIILMPGSHSYMAKKDLQCFRRARKISFIQDPMIPGVQI